MRSEKPGILKGLSVWKLAGLVTRGILKDNCEVYAAQMAYFFLFALFPFLLFLTTLLAYLPVPNLLQVLLGTLGSFVPAEILSLMEGNLRNLVSVRQGGLLSIGAVLALLTASSGVTAVITALNNAYETPERRSFWKVRAIAILLVISLSLFIIISIFLLMIGPRVGAWIAALAGLGKTFTLAWNLLHWPVILCLMMTALPAFYRFAPDVRLSWRETVPGSVLATGVWVAVSLAFSYYVNNFGSYDRTYGSIGAVIVLLTWMYASGFAILLGGEINARLKEAEQGAGRETTGGNKMRKRIITSGAQGVLSADQNWMDLENVVQVELTSEDAFYPIESALKPAGGSGWRASEPGRQTIRLLFDDPVRIRRIHLEFQEDVQQRTQEYVLRWSSDGSRSYSEIVRQQFTFSPLDTSRETEEYAADLAGLTVLELIIVPDISGGDAKASLARLRLA